MRHLRVAQHCPPHSASVASDLDGGRPPLPARFPTGRLLEPTRAPTARDALGQLKPRRRALGCVANLRARRPSGVARPRVAERL
eukprot:4786240-Pyramimonas_sp.AAC.1